MVSLEIKVAAEADQLEEEEINDLTEKINDTLLSVGISQVPDFIEESVYLGEDSIPASLEITINES